VVVDALRETGRRRDRAVSAAIGSGGTRVRPASSRAVRMLRANAEPQQRLLAEAVPGPACPSDDFLMTAATGLATRRPPEARLDVVTHSTDGLAIHVLLSWPP
jgi:hypothetical protein